MAAQIALDQGDRGRTVDVVVAEYGNRLRRFDSGGKSLGRLLHVLEAARIGQKRAEGGIEVARNRVGLCAAGGEDAPQKFRQGLRRGDARGRKVPARAEPLDPAIAARRLLYAKQRPRLSSISGDIFKGCGHAASSVPSQPVTVSDSLGAAAVSRTC